MKKVFISIVAITLLVLGLMSEVLAQAPQSIFYQAVVHDAANNLLTNHQICVRFTMHDASGTGTIIYQEKQLVTTDMVGSFSANIGQGTVLGGTFSGINWSNNKKYLQVDLDLTAQCTGYINLGTNELISVPFALYAGTSDSATNAGTAQVNADWNASSGLAQILNKPTIPVFPPTGGSTLQYINGIGQLITFPTNVSSFTNDAGYLTNVMANGLFIQNNTTQQSSANFNIDGSGTIANQLSVGGNTTVTGAKTVTGLTTLNGGINETGNTNITTATAGNVVISDPTPPAAAVVDVAGTTQGFLPPRMTTAQRDAITVNLTTTPQLTTAQGLTIYNLDTHCIETFVGTHTPANLNWQPIGCGCSGPPAAPGTIIGADTICTGGNITYTVPAVAATNYLYTWTLPNGATIVSGAGTDSITVSYGANAVSGNVSVTAGNSCGTGTATSLAVVVTQTSVAPANLFARPTTICSGDSSSLTQSGGSLGTGATWNWYSDAGYTNFVGTGASADASLWVHPTQTTTYYLQSTASTGLCGGANVQGPSTGVTVTVTPGPAITAPASVCIGSTAQLTPATGGTWTSSDNTLATVDNTGLITGVAAGNPTFTFTSTGGCSSTTPPVAVDAAPVVSAPASVCIGATAQLTPSSGGTWISSDNTSATVNNSGVITGVATGNPSFTFTQTGGCSSSTAAVTVSAAPIVNAPASVCVGSAVNVTPAAGGTWASSDNNLATVTNSGIVTGINAGSPTFTFTAAGGCSNTTSAITVNPLPVVSAGSSVCVGSSITLSPTTGGTWASSNNSLATINNAGVVTGVASGNPTFTFTLTASGCSNTTSAVSVTGSTATANAGAALAAICENSTTAALGGSVGGSATGGVWSDGGVGGTFNSGATNLNTTWTPPANYTGTVTLTLSTTGGTCGDVTASKTETVNGSGSTGSQTFNYTGGVQHFTVSSNTCATSITVDVRGAQGGYSLHNANSTTSYESQGGLGGRVQGIISVTPGQVLDVYVGGQGGHATAIWPATQVAGTGGYNGGGNGGAIGIYFGGGAGGGASDIRPTGGGLGTRMVVAGGGGGGGNWTAGTNTDEGGPGGGVVGGAGYAASVQGGTTGGSLGTPGGGGTQTAGGAAGYWMAGYGGCTQAKGGLGTGGATCNSTDAGCGTAACQDDPGGGGGGGYYGGGAATQSGGGGGSSYPATGVTHTQGYQTGNGQIIISWP